MQRLIQASGLVLLAAASATAQGTIPLTPERTLVSFPNSGPYKLLRSFQSMNNPHGLPAAPPERAGMWPVNVHVGDIDNDGRDDLLFVAEQRFLLAVGFNVDAQGVPTSPYVIYTHFDPNGTWENRQLYKKHWGFDHAAIFDFDGDGLNEVAAIIGPGGSTSGSFRAVIFEDPGTAVQPFVTTDPTHILAGSSIPVVKASVEIDSLQNNWTNSLTDYSGKNAVARGCNVRGLPVASDLLISDNIAGRPVLMSYQAGQLVTHYSQPYMGNATHYLETVDMNGDGAEEILRDGFIDLANGCLFDVRLDPLVQAWGSGNHGDEVRPWDADGDGDLELFVAHDGWDLLYDTGANCSAPLLWERSTDACGNPAVYHGQSATTAKLLAQPDSFGWGGGGMMHMITTPKGPPIYNGRGAIVVNGDGDELVLSQVLLGQDPEGPNLGLEVINWDGKQLRDEVYSNWNGKHWIWRLKSNPDNCPTGHPYRWEALKSYTNDSTILMKGARVLNYFGDGRTEILSYGNRGVEFISNPAILGQ